METTVANEFDTRDDRVAEMEKAVKAAAAAAC